MFRKKRKPMLTNKEIETIRELAEKVRALSAEGRCYFGREFLRTHGNAPKIFVSQEHSEALDAILLYCDGSATAAARLVGVTVSAFYAYKSGRLKIGPRVDAKIRAAYAMTGLGEGRSK